MQQMPRRSNHSTHHPKLPRPSKYLKLLLISDNLDVALNENNSKKKYKLSYKK